MRTANVQRQILWLFLGPLSGCIGLALFADITGEIDLARPAGFTRGDGAINKAANSPATTSRQAENE
jgi:hypothetical protein